MTKILNLTYPDKSNIKYRIDKFPDGQQQVVILTTTDPRFPINNGYSINQLKNISIEIKSRLNNFKDLELIICATQSLRELGVKEIHLYTPYFMGARSDRKFEEGSNNYLKHVICPIINSMNYESVTVLDPHSNVLEACLNKFRRAPMNDFYDKAYVELKLKRDEFIIISPDAGALHRVNQAASQMRYKGDIITCSKERDTQGKLSKISLGRQEEYLGTHTGKDFIIIDDICDGGATFINIADKVKPFTNKLYLIVTHGIFSKGFSELNKYFDGIYCTNSYSDIDTVFKPFKELNGYEKDFVKQLNVF